jgi:hypothetical protein
VVVVEEAGEVLEAHLLACLSKHTEHLLLIGDHEQLRPKVERYELQAASGRGHDLDVSLFEALVTSSGFPREVRVAGCWIAGACLGRCLVPALGSVGRPRCPAPVTGGFAGDAALAVSRGCQCCCE